MIIKKKNEDTEVKKILNQVEDTQVENVQKSK